MRRALQRANTFHTEDKQEKGGEGRDGGASGSGSASRTGTDKKVRKIRSPSKLVIPQAQSVPDIKSTSFTQHYHQLSNPAGKVTGGGVKTTISLSDIVGKLNTAWSKPVDQTPLSMDLPRLASRIIVHDKRTNGGGVTYHPVDGTSAKDLVSQLLLHLAELLHEPPHIIEHLIQHIQQSSPTDPIGELRHWTEELIAILGEHSKTVAVAKLLHQSIIMPLATQIKVVILAHTNSFTKDVRTPDGWRIHVILDDDRITCTHVKKEVSMTTAPLAFEFEWHLRIHLNSDATLIDHTEIDLTALSCCEGMPKDIAQKLADAMTSTVVV